MFPLTQQTARPEEIRKNWVTKRRGEAFMALGLETADWHYDGRTLHEEAECELCGTPIVWRYALHHGPTGKTLWVGCECIQWYYKAYFPNGIERAVALLKQQTRAIWSRLVQERLDKFRLEEPSVVEYLMTPSPRERRGRKLLCYIDVGIVKMIPFSQFRASLLRKGYLKPKELEIFKSAFDKSLAGAVNG
jgi:hypothetical protein